MHRIPIYILLFIAIPLVGSGCGSAPKIKPPRTQELSTSHTRKGLELMDRMELDKAVLEFQKAIRVNRSIDNRAGIAAGLINLSRIFMIMEKVELAASPSAEALSIAGSAGDESLLAEALATRGKYEYLTGNMDEGMKNISAAIELDSKSKSVRIAERLNLKASIQLSGGDVEGARTSYSEGLSHGLASKNRLETANSYRGLGEISRKKGSYKEASGLFEKALEEDRGIGNGGKVLTDLILLGGVSLEGQDYKAAADYYMRGYGSAVSMEKKKEALECLDGVIKAYKALGENGRATALEQEKALIK